MSPDPSSGRLSQHSTSLPWNRRLLQRHSGIKKCKVCTHPFVLQELMKGEKVVETVKSEERRCDTGCCSRETNTISPTGSFDDEMELESITPDLCGESDCCNIRNTIDRNTDCCDKTECCPPRPVTLNDADLIMDQEALKIIQQCCCLRGTVCCSTPSKSWCCDYVLTWQTSGHRLSELRFENSSHGRPSAGVDSITFDVEGMTCSSCESTLKNTLLRIEGVENASVSVVLGRAVVEGSVPAEEVIQIVYEKTGFKLLLVSNQPTLLLRFGGQCPDKFPPDVLVSVHGQTVKFTYDPKRITAREIFDFYAGGDITPVVVDELEVHSHVWTTLGCRVIVSILLAIPVLVLAYIPPRPILYGAIQLTLVTVIMVYVISPLYKQALVTLLRRHEIEMDLLVVGSTSIAYIFSVVSFAFTCLARPISEPFWETPALLVTLIMFGRWVTTRTRERAVKAVKSLSSVNVKTAMLRTGRVVDVALLGYNDVITVQPGETIPTDGIIVQGETEVSEAMFTGEPTPQLKLRNSTVFAGSINLLSRVDIQVTKLASENALTDIRQLIDISQINKPRIQSYTDRVAGYLGPLALFIAILAFFIWFLIDWRLRGQTSSTAAIQGITYAIAVLAISCPCTIGLAVPMNIVIASGVAAARGILIKDTQALEIVHRAKHVVFDKTGTLTVGDPVVVEEVLFVEGAHGYVGRLVAGTTHPIARAVGRYVGDATPFDCVKSIAGKGLEVNVDGGVLRGGNTRWLGLESSGLKMKTSGSVFCVTLNGELIALYGLSDELRPESLAVVKTLQEKRVQVYLVSGDNAAATTEIARQLGILTSRVQSNVLPADKATFVKDLQTQTHSPVIFCGDGINDAAALAQADVGISFISASQITSSSATVLFLSNDLAAILTLLSLSRRVYNRIVVNFVWAGVYNFFAICLAAGVFVVWRVEPKWAGIGEFISVMPVVIVGWSLKWMSGM